ncbi:microtubule organization protein AKNA isoform X2 [Kryptolebias marmoratus]|uniref:AT-hook transcription factor n=1 Tax=Kryptolebias marmoratus TaxID=37003 RepID=A0A3Q3ASA4_KRYMA|nr:microtubule organization protein AKNA isoform X2 [Kryptolebias marmoratus]
METSRKTRPGVLLWTPAPPAQNSSSNSSSAEVSCEDKDDFVSQMDENGIMGLSVDLEDLEDLELVGRLKGKAAEDLREAAGAPPAREDMKKVLKASEVKRRTDDRKTELRTGGDRDVTEEDGEKKPEPIRRVNEPAEASARPRPAPRSFLPVLSHFTAEELAAAPGIDAETLPDFSGGLPSSKSSPRCPFSERIGPGRHRPLSHSPAGGAEERHEEPPPPPTRTFTGGVKTDPVKSKQHRSRKDSRIPRIRKNAAEGEDIRKGSLSRQTPDFSKVEPRVYFPKAGYTPPRRTQPLTTSPEAPIAFKSPADIVQEVLFDADRSPPPPPESPSPTSAANFTVPPEFRCRQQASALLQQLQDDYNRLLTKYAEAENTIDRLRLEARVNLTFDSPEAGASAHSGLNHDASKLLQLDFPPARRAETTPARLRPDGCRCLQDPPNAPPAQQLSNLLLSRTETFLQQLQTFEDLLKSEKLSSCEKMEGVSQLSEGLGSLERSYLLARDDHKQLLQSGAETCRFDPERELEGLIFECGLRLEELKEEQTSPPPRPPSASEEEQTLTHPQSPAGPSLVGTSDEEEDEETLRSFFFRPQIKAGKQNQTLKDLSKSSSPDFNTPGSEEEEQRSRRTRESPSQSKKVESDPDSPVCSENRRLCSGVGPSSGSPAPPAHSRRRFETRTSHSSSLSSLADPTSGRRRREARTGSERVLLQDGIVSPETDSGFVGSESSRPAPAAASRLLHRRATESVSVPRDAGPPASPPSSQEPPAGPQLDPNQPRRNGPGQRRRALSCSPRHRGGQTTGTPSGSEAAHTDRFSGSVNSLSGSPPAAVYLHGDAARAPSSSRGGDHTFSGAVVTLQAEVTRLKEKMENYTLGSAASAERGGARRGACTPPDSFVDVWSDGSLGRRETAAVDEVEREKSTSAQKQRLTRSELESPAHASRCSQTSAERRGCSPVPVRSRKTQTGQNSAEEPDGRDPARLCPRCRSNPGGPVERPPGGDREPARCSRCRCSVCGGLKAPSRRPGNDFKALTCRRDSNSGCGERSRQPAAAPPSTLHFTPSLLLLASAPLYSSPDAAGVPSGVGRPEERTGRTGRTRRSVSVDKRRSLDGSLNRAIRAARHMRLTSGHMARSLASGLQHRDRLAASCSY